MAKSEYDVAAVMGKDSGKQYLSENDIRVGREIPWSLYDEQGNLLLKKGALITSENQAESLIRLRACYYFGPDRTQYAPLETTVEKWSPYRVVTTLLDRLDHIYKMLPDPNRHNDFVRCLLRMVIDIQTICAENPHSALGTIQLILSAPTRLIHPVHTALISEVAGSRLGWGVMERIPLVAAALTQNLGMLDVQDDLAEQHTPLSEKQKEIIQSHPKRSAQMLTDCGVQDKRWLRAVLQHHERLDGSGYPAGLEGDTITTEARLLAIADSYVAMTRPRAYRGSMRTRAAMAEIFKQRGAAIDDRLSKLFLRVMGVFSPGTLVRLSGGEIAIVMGHTNGPDTPDLAILTNTAGKHLNPIEFRHNFEITQINGILDPRDHRILVGYIDNVWPRMNGI